MRKCYILIFLIMISFYNAVLFGQAAKSKLYLLDNDEADKPKILVLYQGSNGLILCGTTKGLYRFDGFDFSTYSLQSKNDAAITAIFETKDKRTLIGFNNGNIGQLINNSIQLLKFDEGFPKKAIKSIIEDSGGII